MWGGRSGLHMLKNTKPQGPAYVLGCLHMDTVGSMHAEDGRKFKFMSSVCTSRKHAYSSGRVQGMLGCAKVVRGLLESRGLSLKSEVCYLSCALRKVRLQPRLPHVPKGQPPSRTVERVLSGQMGLFLCCRWLRERKPQQTSTGKGRTAPQGGGLGLGGC